MKRTPVFLRNGGSCLSAIVLTFSLENCICELVSFLTKNLEL